MKDPVTPFNDPKARFQAGLFGMWLFLIALGVLFVSTILGYIYVRVDNGSDFIPDDAPPLPKLLLASTAALMVSSYTMQRALQAARTGQGEQGRWMLLTLGLAVGFLVMQAVAWYQMLAQHLHVSDSLYAWSFYVLTALHAAHVVGGLPPMLVATVRAMRDTYTPGNHRGIAYCAMYWHFLDAVWLLLYATLWIGGV